MYVAISAYRIIAAVPNGSIVNDQCIAWLNHERDAREKARAHTLATGQTTYVVGDEDEVCSFRRIDGAVQIREGSPY